MDDFGKDFFGQFSGPFDRDAKVKVRRLPSGRVVRQVKGGLNRVTDLGQNDSVDLDIAERAHCGCESDISLMYECTVCLALSCPAHSAEDLHGHITCSSPKCCKAVWEQEVQEDGGEKRVSVIYCTPCFEAKYPRPFVYKCAGLIWRKIKGIWVSKTKAIGRTFQNP